MTRRPGCGAGDLAADLDHEWLELERIHLRRRSVRAAQAVEASARDLLGDLLAE